ncbi:hypothetical protein MVEN_00506300 [Mycena venus]|uniref:Uncharacterized protein n=1 Tax=Mycena venus TaxID=2733690 RepID=A0A8H7D4Z0_9AGAR|nr:hypothetical protein MVEN_00506300 [Mycena venus]
MDSSPVPLGRTVLYLTVGLVVQMFVFGGYTVIIFLSTRMLMRRGLKSPANRVLLVITLFMYLLSAAYCAYRLADLISRIQFFIEDPQTLQAASTPITHLITLFNALTLLNYLLCDGVVIWRARLICAANHRKFLYFPLFLLILTSLAVAGVIGVRIASIYSVDFEETPHFAEVVNILQVSAINISLLSNLSSTGVVGITTWRHRKAIRDGFNKTTKGDQILRILFESGVFYCIAGLFGLASTLIKLPYNTLGDLYTPVNVQIAGAYTPIVLLLVSMQRPLNEASFLGTIPETSNPVCETSPTGTPRDGMHFDVAFKETENKKGHRHHPSDMTLV